MDSYCWESWSKRFRTELLRLRSRPHLQTSRHGLHRFVSLRARPCQAVRSAIFARPNTATLPPRGTSAGGGYSTVEDLLRFSNALLGRKLLNAEYTELVTTGKVATGSGNGKYAYGFPRTASAGSATAVE